MKTLSPSFFEGRFLIEIRSWALLVRLTGDAPKAQKIEDGLEVARSINIQGRILGPEEHRGNEIGIQVTPFGRKKRFQRRSGRLGLFRLPDPAATAGGHHATILLPEADLALLGVALGSTSRYLDLWTAEPKGNQSDVTMYALSATVHDNIRPWAGLD